MLVTQEDLKQAIEREEAAWGQYLSARRCSGASIVPSSEERRRDADEKHAYTEWIRARQHAWLIERELWDQEAIEQ